MYIMFRKSMGYLHFDKLAWRSLENHPLLIGNTSSSGCFSIIYDHGIFFQGHTRIN